MSGKGGQRQSGGGGGGGSGGGGGGGGGSGGGYVHGVGGGGGYGEDYLQSQTATNDNPQIVTGWEHTRYAFNSDRYQYIGKEEDSNEPQFLDFGGKAANAAADAAKQGGGK